MTAVQNPFGARTTLSLGTEQATIFRLDALARQGLATIDRLPYSVRVLLENALRHCGHGLVTEDHVRGRYTDEALARLVDLQLDRVRRLLAAGAPLAGVLKGRAGLEIRLIVCTATRMLQRLEMRPDPFTRAVLRPRDWVWGAWQALARPSRSFR
jgi:hypothetical protein